MHGIVIVIYCMCIYTLLNVNLVVVCKTGEVKHSTTICNSEVSLYTIQVLWHKMLMRGFNIPSQTSTVALPVILEVKSHHLAVGVASAHFLAS